MWTYILYELVWKNNIENQYYEICSSQVHDLKMSSNRYYRVLPGFYNYCPKESVDRKPRVMSIIVAENVRNVSVILQLHIAPLADVQQPHFHSRLVPSVPLTHRSPVVPVQVQRCGVHTLHRARNRFNLHLALSVTLTLQEPCRRSVGCWKVYATRSDQHNSIPMPIIF